jgi:hypothetical protein
VTSEDTAASSHFRTVRAATEVATFYFSRPEIRGRETLVTGGAGFIGGHIAERFTGRGHDVTVLDNFESYHHAGIKEHTYADISKANSPIVCEPIRIDTTVATTSKFGVLRLARTPVTGSKNGPASTRFEGLKTVKNDDTREF